MFGRKKEIRLTTHDTRKRRFVVRFWLKYRIISAFFRCLNVAVIFKQSAVLSLDLILFKWGARSLVNSRCLLTGRSRAVSNTYRVSRFAFRTVANLGIIDGLSRAS